MSGGLSSGLYVVSTPIGNLGDITARALEVLRCCDCIAAEDTRVTGGLMRRLGIKPRKLVSCHDHSSESRVMEIASMARLGPVALVSDAGTPLVSDPGHRLVEVCTQSGVGVFSVPGASSLTAALSICGLPVGRFIFIGFPMGNFTEYALRLVKSGFDGCFVLFVPGRDIVDFLSKLKGELPDWYSVRVSVCREMTKMFEEVRSGEIDLVLGYYSENCSNLKGESVVVVRFVRTGRADLVVDIGKAIANLINDNGFLKEMKVKGIVSFLDKYHGDEVGSLNKKELYAKVLELLER